MPVTTVTASTPEQLTFDILFDALPDVAMRDQKDGMERAWVSLGKSKRTTAIHHEISDTEYVKIVPHPDYGMATIWDWDIIIYLVAQLMARSQNTVLPDAPAVEVHPHAILTAIGRGTGGRDYALLREAIARLQYTVLETNLWQRNKKRLDRHAFIVGFTEIDAGAESSGGMRFLLPPWIVNSVKARGVLSIHRSYFNLEGGFERFLYRVARKMCGHQVEAKIGLRGLHERSGSPMRFADFAKAVRKAVGKEEVPEYRLEIYKNADGEEILRMTQATLSRLPGPA
ncbi:replication initiator protein A [Azospirillum sp. SYSU D00513]|uniref:replication initiator protein A n=1 Tax=Azospirillum sp. SYSU D00513 TaxID=2812561 RepID=UPI001A971D26|nr:replication initiator protein A [Azospirillum sp. SYSU D00513]